jgi:hypothetical protein
VKQEGEQGVRKKGRTYKFLFMATKEGLVKKKNLMNSRISDLTA